MPRGMAGAAGRQHHGRLAVRAAAIASPHVTIAAIPRFCKLASVASALKGALEFATETDGKRLRNDRHDASASVLLRAVKAAIIVE
jgi:hypothetical protein